MFKSTLTLLAVVLGMGGMFLLVSAWVGFVSDNTDNTVLAFAIALAPAFLTALGVTLYHDIKNARR